MLRNGAGAHPRCPASRLGSGVACVPARGSPGLGAEVRPAGGPCRCSPSCPLSPSGLRVARGCGAPRPLGVFPAVALLLGPDSGGRCRSWPLFLPHSRRSSCPLFTLLSSVLHFHGSALGLQVQMLGFRTRRCRCCSPWKLLGG